MALTVKVAWPVLDASAVKVTACAVAKLAGVKVSEDPPVTDRPVLPAVRAVVTVTFAAGAADSERPTVPVVPWVTDSAGDVATMVPVAVPVVSVTVTVMEG